jgi:Fe-S oxidoreductase
VIWRAQVELVKKGIGPLETPNKVMEGIQKLGNSVFGDPAKRWDWLPEEFPKKESDTLFFVGCLPCYLVPRAAISSYLVLKELGVDFMMLKDEGCCGHYFYNLGRLDLARESFEENRERFKRLGIKRIITTCIGCHHSFDVLYPKLLGEENDFEALNLVQILPELLRKKSETQKLKLGERLEATYHDSCASRVMGKDIYDKPREALNLCGVNLVEMDENREHTLCCGGGGGIATTFRSLSIEVGARLLDKVKTNNIVTTCPACFLRLSYDSRKREKGKKIFYITEPVLDSLKHSPLS